MAMTNTKELAACKICKADYDITEVHRHFGSDHNQTCWPCLQKWVEKCANDPYRAGVAFMRNEAPHGVMEDLVQRFKTAFELTQKMLLESPKRPEPK